MEKLFDFIFDGMTSLFQGGGLLPLMVVAAILIVTLIIGKKGLGGLGFWGKKRTKLEEYTFKDGSRTRKIIIYRLSGRRGYQGYGIEFARAKFKVHVGEASIKSSAFSIEFTKQEADELADLIAPYLEQQDSRQAGRA